MAEANTDAALHAIADSNVNFTLDIHRVMDAGNIFYSPVSIHVILALVYFGARGETARQIRDGLRLTGEDDDIERGIEATMAKLNASDDILLDIANRVFPQARFKIEKGFLQYAEKFMAGVEAVDFSQSEAARKVINDWVEMNTHDKIKGLIPSGVLKSQTRLVLVNAVYFKAEWQKQFDKSKTASMPFYSGAGSMKNVDMMQMKSSFKYAEMSDLKSQVLALPYKGNKLIMLILLPTKVNGLSELESKLSNVNLQDVMSDMEPHDVTVFLPKFKMEYEKELNGMLAGLGMTDMFIDGNANFTGITNVPLYVSKVLHKAFVEVTEEGTEAAAATAVVFDTRSVGGNSPVLFRANHPFLFFIMDSLTRLVLFAGRYASPP